MSARAQDRCAIWGCRVLAENEDGPTESKLEDALELGGLQIGRRQVSVPRRLVACWLGRLLSQ